MSRRNSRQAKKLRRETKAERNFRIQQEELKNIESVPTPDEYIKHTGHIPNVPQFFNSAYAVNSRELRLVLRTKKQIVDYVENNPDKQIITSKTGKSCIRLSFVYPVNKKEIQKDGLGNWSWMPTKDEEGRPYHPMKKGEDNSQQLYQVIHCPAENMGQDGEENMKIWKRDNPFYSNSNSVFVDLDDIPKLPEKRMLWDELVYFAKGDEKLSPMDEVEVENFLSKFSESDLREQYEHYKGQLIMDEFESEMDGEILYQPRKTEKSWKYAIFNAPLVDDKRHFTIITPEMSKGKEKSEEITVNY